MPITWTAVRAYEDIRYEHTDGIAKITINRPEVRNAFRPRTLAELQDAFTAARDDASVGVVILTGEGPEAFCSGGDQRVRGHAGYVDDAGVPRLNRQRMVNAALGDIPGQRVHALAVRAKAPGE